MGTLYCCGITRVQFSSPILYLYLFILHKILVAIFVQANRHVTRTDVFWYLVQLLQQRNISPSETDDKYQKIEMLHQMSITETLSP